MKTSNETEKFHEDDNNKTEASYTVLWDDDGFNVSCVFTSVMSTQTFLPMKNYSFHSNNKSINSLELLFLVLFCSFLFYFFFSVFFFSFFLYSRLKMFFHSNWDVNGCRFILEAHIKYVENWIESTIARVLVMFILKWWKCSKFSIQHSPWRSEFIHWNVSLDVWQGKSIESRKNTKRKKYTLCKLVKWYTISSLTNISYTCYLKLKYFKWNEYRLRL